MEPLKTENLTNQPDQNRDVNKTESAENFQKFIYELFDKHGILNDLRAYLRGHIVNVLKNAQTGDPPSCQKHFTQRLDTTFQALNMLVAEYLLSQEFNYSLSVFVSEIPLANMVFGFAKSLMDLGGDGEANGLRFGENDVWSILNYLGIKCDAEHVNKIVEMYKTQEKSPLLLCILNCAQLSNMQYPHMASSPEGSVSTSSSNSEHKLQSQCKHYTLCKSCRRRYKHVKNKYRDKKKHYIQNVQANVNAPNVESLMKNIGVLERTLIDEMFEQLRSVYETEMDMYKEEHEGKIKKSLDSHAQHFQRMKDELEESFKAREIALETNIEHKKRFLWGLAQALRTQHSQMTKAMQAVKKQTAELADQALRTQHAQMTKAMQAVKKQTAELADQEQNLKAQRTEAENSLKKHAEEMRQQIANELNILERNLESMKTERDSINRERSQLDIDSETKINNEVKNYLQTHYNLLRNELGVVKMYIENASFRPKVVTECGTITEDLGKGMNNEATRIVKEVKPNQVVNDLKKQKNVNFSPQCKSGESSATGSGSTSSEELNLTRQAQMSLLAQARLQADVRPRIAPAAPRIERSMCDSINESGWRKGAGEERSLFASTQILVPGDTLPFVGLIERRTSGRRHLLNRWRAIRRRVSPLANPESCPARPPEMPAERGEIRMKRPSSNDVHGKEVKEQEDACHSRDNMRPEATTTARSQKREKSPRSVLKEAKENLKTVTRPSTRREKSPSAMLREAKMRLRKLEIEAEAVARSYRDFRRRADLRHPSPDEQSSIPRPVSKLESRHKEIPEPSKPKARATNSMSFDLENYLKKYQINLDIEDQFSKKNTEVLENTVTKVYSELIRNVEPIPKYDYLDKPIHEFRKLYHTNSVRIRTSSPLIRKIQEPLTLSNKRNDNRIKENSETRNKDSIKRDELELLNQNIAKIYGFQDEVTNETVDMSKEDEETEVVNNILTVEVENVSEVRELKAESTDMIVVVEGSVDSKEILSERDSIDRASTRMNISPKHFEEPRDRFDRLGSVDSRVEDREDKEQISLKMTILISPKEIDVPVDTTEISTPVMSQSPSKIANLSNNESKEFTEIGRNKDPNNDGEIRNDPDYELQLDLHKQVSDNDEAPVDYPDDFSFDVDNYKSEGSPISLPKTSEDENFWD